MSAAYGWTFTDAGNGQFYVQNYGTKEYIEPNSNGVNGATKTTATPIQPKAAKNAAAAFVTAATIALPIAKATFAVFMAAAYAN